MGIYYWVCALQVYWNWPITVECAHSTFGFLLAKFNGMALFRRTILSLCTRRTHGSSHWHVRVFFSSCVSSSSNAVCLSRWFYRRESGDRNLFIVDKYLQFRSMMGREKKYVARRRRRRTHFALYTQNGWSKNNSATEAMGRRKKYRDEREKKRESARDGESEGIALISPTLGTHAKRKQKVSALRIRSNVRSVASEKRDQNRIVSFKDKVFLFFRW